MNRTEAPRKPLRVRPGDGILIVRLGAVGDVIRTLPCLSALRKSLPETRLGWVVERGSRSLLPGPPFLDAVFEFPRRELSAAAILANPASLPGLLAGFFARLSGFKPRLTLDFQGTAKSALLARFSRAPWRIGFDRSGSREASHLLQNYRVSPSSPRLNRVFKNLELVKALGVAVGPPDFPFAPLAPSARISAFLGSLAGGVPIAIHPGTSAKQAHKRWPEERYASVARILAEEGCAPVLTWGPGEEGMVQRVASLAQAKVFIAPPTTLSEMRALLVGCRLFIGGDTGPMHLAWTHGLPVVALFGSTDPRINGPLGEGHRILAPAWEGGRPNPRRGDSSPLHEITVAQVVTAAREVLASRAAVIRGETLR